MASKRKAPKSPSNGEASAQKATRSSKRSKAEAIAEEEDFVLEHSDAEDENVAIESNQKQVELLEEARVARVAKRSNSEEESVFIGEPVSVDEAKRRWPHRYLSQVASFLQIHQF